MTFTDEELNYFRVCKAIASIINDGLRTVFKQEWDNRYKATKYGQWQDTTQNGNDFYNMESWKNRNRKKMELAIMKNGNTKEWDCTCLCYAILSSDSVGKGVNATVRKSVDELRNFRNDKKSFHIPRAELTKADFKSHINKVISAFAALKLDTALIEELRDQKSFPTNELEEMKRQLEKEKKRNEEPRPFCVLPPKPSHDTTNRLNEVREISKEMERLRNTKKNEVTVVYLSGNPGCGKSEVARQVAERFSGDKSTEMNFVMTLDASSINRLLTSYVKFAGRVRCNEDSITKIGTSKDLSQEEKLDDLRSLISPRLQGYSSWLIIVDNVSDLKSISKYWPQAGERTNGVGQILVTTQDSSSIPFDHYTYHLPLKEGMNQDDAISMLSEVSGISSDKNTLLEVAKALDFQPLALACAVVYIKYAQLGTDWTKYLQKLEGGKREATETAYKKISSAYSATMTEAVRMAVEKVLKQDQVMMHAFQFLSVIAPESISLLYVVQYVTNCLPDKDEEDVAASICSSSLVLSSEGDGPKEIRVHQVVYNYLQTSEFGIDGDIILDVVSAFVPLVSEDVNEIEEIITKRLVVQFSSIAIKIQHIVERNPSASAIPASINIFELIASSFKIGEICDRHAKYEVCKIFFEMSFKLQESKFYDNYLSTAVTLKLLGSTLEKLGKSQEAKGYFDRAVAIDKAKTILYDSCQEGATAEAPITDLENADGNSSAVTDQNIFPEDSDDDDDEAEQLITLGHNYLKQKKFREAKTYFEKALKIQESIYGNNHPLVADSLNKIGETLCCMKNYNEAKMHFERALSIQKTVHDFIFTFLDTTHHILAKLFWDKGQYQKAEIYLERAMAVQEIKYSENHSSLVHTLNYAGRNLCLMGKYNEAKRCLEKAMKFQEETHNETQDGLVKTLNNLGDTLYEMGQYKESESHLVKALKIQKKASLETEKSFVDTLKKLAKTYIETGQMNQAKELSEKALSIEENLYDENDPKLVDALNEQGDFLRQIFQYQSAKNCLYRAQKIQDARFRKTHPNIVNTLKILGDVFFDEGNTEEAKRCLKEALAKQEKVYSDTHPELVDTLEKLGEILRNNAQYNEAIIHLKRALAIQELAFNVEHPDIADTLEILSDVYCDMSKYEEAKQHLSRALAIQINVYGEEHHALADTLNNLGALCQEMGVYEEAKQHLNRALTIQINVYGEEHHALVDTLNNLGSLSQKKGQYEDANKCLTKALTIQEKVYGKESPKLINTLSKLEKLCHVLREFQEAKEHRERMLTITKRNYLSHIRGKKDLKRASDEHVDSEKESKLAKKKK